MLGDLAEFAFHVETARSIYRKFPELVTASEFPEHLRAAFVEGTSTSHLKIAT